MRKLFATCALLIACTAAHALDITGKWQTIDDKTGKPKAIVQIEENGGKYSGKIISLSEGVKNVCDGCKDDKKGSPLVGLTVLRDLVAKGDGYEGGHIFDPKSGNDYKCTGKLIDDGKSLKLRGYVGVELFGRSQTWKRVE